MAETKKYIDLPDLALYKQLEEAEFAQALADGLRPKVDRVEQGANGKALIFNESDGGGAKFEHTDGTMSFVGVNDGGENGITGQLYTVKKDDATGKNVGTRLNLTKDGFFYTTGKDSAAFTADDEIATKGDLAGISADDKTVYLTNSGTAQSGMTYQLYQGADPLDMSHNTLVGEIKVAGCVSSGTLETVTTPDVPYPGAKVGDKYIDLVLADEQGTHIYIPVTDLITEYTVEQNASQVQLAISPEHEISATLVDGGVSTEKLADKAVTSAKLADAVNATIAGKVDRQIVSNNNKALIFNESDGGGAKFENADGTYSFIGVNDGGANGIAAQIYAKDKDTNVGTRINVTQGAIYYTNGKTNGSYEADDEIATKGYVDDIAGDATEAVPEQDIRNLFAGPSV